MRISIGTKNNAKVEAVKEIVKEYDFLIGSEVKSIKVDSLVSEQPKSFDEMITGAKNRAKESFIDCDYSFGVESGITPVDQTKSGYLEFTCCVIFDGNEFHIGMSNGWDMPLVLKEYLDEGYDLTQASVKAGFSSNENLGEAEGVIGVMTKGKVNRKEYTKNAIRMALIHLQNKD